MQQLNDFVTTHRQFSGVESGELLPSLPAGVPELLRSVTDSNVDFEALAAEIAKFPSISARLLFLANSAWAASNKPTTNLLQACTKLGLTVVRSVALSLSIAAPFNPYRCRSFDARQYWRDLLMVSEASLLLGRYSRQVKDNELAVVHTAGVLHSVGMLWFADRYSDEMNAVFEQKQITPELSVSEIMTAVSNADYSYIGGELADCWSLPMVLRAIIAEHNNPNYQGSFWPSVLTVGYATKLVDSLSGDIDSVTNDIRIARLKVTEPEVLNVIKQLHDMDERTTLLVNSFVK